MQRTAQVGHEFILEVPTTGPIDEDRVEAAPVLGFHLGGSLPPLFMIRTWSDEIPQHRNLAAGLGPDQPMYSIAPPSGPEMDDYPATPEEWRDFVIERLLRIPHEGPYLLGSWSFGGVVGLEVAERLAADGRPVQLVAMLDTRIPKSHPRTAPGKRKVRRLNKFAKRLLHYSELDTSSERMAFLRWRMNRYFQKTAKKLRKLAQMGHRRGLSASDETSSEDPFFIGPRGRRMSYLKRSVRVAYLKYQRRLYHVPVALLWCKESLGAQNADVMLGWGPYLRGSVEIHEAPGAHMTLLKEANAQPVADLVARVLRHARESGQSYARPPRSADAAAET